MLVAKSQLQRTLRVLQRFDPSGSPFVGLQFGAETPLFYRSGAEGLIESHGYDHNQPEMVVSLSHFAATLATTAAEQVTIAADRSGILAVLGTHEKDVDDLRVYTVRHKIAWAKTHDPGEKAIEIEREAFKGINTAPFELVSPPVLRRGRLMLATAQGIVMRNQVPVEAYPYPRQAFLRSISTLPVDAMFMTRSGYWGADAGGLRVLVAGHRLGDSVFDTYSDGATPLGAIPAERLVSCLKSASDLAEGDSWIVLDPVQGVLVRDQYSHQNKFTFGVTGTWPAFTIQPRTARFLHDALAQTKEETVELQRMDTGRLRLTRGNWEVSFRLYTPETKHRG